MDNFRPVDRRLRADQPAAALAGVVDVFDEELSDFELSDFSDLAGADSDFAASLALFEPLRLSVR